MRVTLDHFLRLSPEERARVTEIICDFTQSPHPCGNPCLGDDEEYEGEALSRGLTPNGYNDPSQGR